ncbi:hypothetical protein [Solibacillus ferritrahens]|uniref:hypothetical protein n=1 Tax=Solibacillus ferritrahens TaxID=3098620 RepID=UPI00300BEF32
MYNLVLSNLFKGMKSRTIHSLFFVSCLFAGLTMFLTNGVANGKIAGEIANLTFLFSDASMLAILGAILATALIGSEFDAKLFHHSIVAGYSRLQIVTAKALTYWLFLVVIISPYAIFNIAAILLDWSVDIGMPTAGFLFICNMNETVGSKLLLIAVMTVIYVGQLSLAILLAFTLKRALLIIPVFYIVSALTGQVSIYKDSLPVLNVLSVTPFSGKFIALSSDHTVQAIFVSLLFMVVIVVVTFLMFRKVEIK